MFGQHRCGNLERGLRETPPCLHTITGRAIFTAAWLNEDDLTAAVTQRKKRLVHRALDGLSASVTQTPPIVRPGKRLEAKPCQREATPRSCRSENSSQWNGRAIEKEQKWKDWPSLSVRAAAASYFLKETDTKRMRSVPHRKAPGQRHPGAMFQRSVKSLLTFG